MPIDTSMYERLGHAKAVDLPDYAGAMKDGLSLRQLAMQNRAIERQSQAAERDDAVKAQKQRLSTMGNALETLDKVPEDQRPEVYSQMRAKMIQEGVIRPQDALEVYDPNEHQRALGMWKQSPEYLERQKTKAEINHLNAQAKKDGAKSEINLTPGQDAADKAFGKEAAEYYYGGGKASTEKNVAKLEGAVDKLKNSPGLTGGWTTRVPLLNSDYMQDSINPEMSQVRDDIRGAIQGSLRATLGAQFTEKEGEAIFNRSFNPRLSAEENVRRATDEIDAIKRMAAQKDQSMGGFLARGTLKGSRPSGTNLNVNEQMNARAPAPRTPQGGGMGIGPKDANAGPPPIRHGEERQGFVFMGGDPADKKNWKKAR